MSKKDRKRVQIKSKIDRLDQQFKTDKDYHYRDALVQLQFKLSSLHSSNDPQYLQKVRDFEEQRDAELMRLRLAEEYQVQFINKQFKEDYDTIAKDTKKIVQMVKEKLQNRVISRIRQLKEDKALIDIATSSSSTGHVGTRYHHPMNIGSAVGGASRVESGYNSGFDSSSSFFLSSERRSRRHKRYDEAGLMDSNAEDSYESTGATTGYGSTGGRKRHKSKSMSSNNEKQEKPILTDNSRLNIFLYGEDLLKRKEKASMRYSSKGYEGCPPLKPDEVNEDLNLLRNATGAIQLHKRGH